MASFLYIPFAFASISFKYIAKKLRVNQQIRVPQVHIIDDEGKPAGVMDTSAAIEMARQRDLDLVEVAPNAQPPVCKFMDYGKYLYRQQKVDRKHRAQQKQSEVKGIRLGFRIGPHDMEVKAKQARKFLEARNVVKVALVFRGREITHKNIGFDKMEQFYGLLKDVCKLEDRAKSQGNTLFMILSPLTSGASKEKKPTPSPQSQQPLNPLPHESQNP